MPVVLFHNYFSVALRERVGASKQGEVRLEKNKQMQGEPEKEKSMAVKRALQRLARSNAH